MEIIFISQALWKGLHSRTPRPHFENHVPSDNVYTTSIKYVFPYNFKYPPPNTCIRVKAKEICFSWEIKYGNF